mgnify:CR=1 FL=1
MTLRLPKSVASDPRGPKLLSDLIAHTQRLWPKSGFWIPTAGMTAALAIADQGFTTYLVERANELGGRLHELRYTENGDDVGSLLSRLEQRVRSHANARNSTSQTPVRSVMARRLSTATAPPVEYR